MKNIPILNYIKRYWLLLVAIAVLIWAYTSGTLAVTLRGALLIPMFLLIAGASGLLYRNIYCRKLTDKYVDDKGKMQRDWDNMSPFQRIIVMKIESWIFVFCGSLIAAGLLIIINV